MAPPWSPWLRSGSVIDRRSTAENFQNRGPSTPSHRRRGAIAVRVRHKPQWHRHDRRDSAVVPSLIAVALRICSKLPQCQPRVGPIIIIIIILFIYWAPYPASCSWRSPDRRGTAITAAAPPWLQWHRTMTAVAPTSPPRLRSTTTVQLRQSRLTLLRRSRGVSTAVMAVLRRCYHLTGPAVLPPTPL